MCDLVVPAIACLPGEDKGDDGGSKGRGGLGTCVFKQKSKIWFILLLRGCGELNFIDVTTRARVTGGRPDPGPLSLHLQPEEET